MDQPIVEREPSIVLTEDELRDLTKIRNRKNSLRWELQRRALFEMGIAHKVRGDGSLVVSRQHFEDLLAGRKSKTKRSEPGPNWDAIG